jgi:hypothetical protein
MSFLRRDHAHAHPPPVDERASETPAALRDRLSALVAVINVSAGRLPIESVVAALAVTDTLGEVIDSSGVNGLDVRALVSLQGILDDYLPTTLRAYLSLEPSVTDVARPSGQTPKTSLLEQIDALWLASSDLLNATRARDADALLTQGNFLRAKFTRSDLDL